MKVLRGMKNDFFSSNPDFEDVILVRGLTELVNANIMVCK